jgi:hypothetical protein
MKFYAFGSGSFGCLYDHVEGPYLTAREAADVAADSFELRKADRAELARAGFLSLPSDAGAEYVEVFEVDEHWTAD